MLGKITLLLDRPSFRQPYKQLLSLLARLGQIIKHTHKYQRQPIISLQYIRLHSYCEQILNINKSIFIYSQLIYNYIGFRAFKSRIGQDKKHQQQSQFVNKLFQLIKRLLIFWQYFRQVRMQQVQQRTTSNQKILQRQEYSDEDGYDENGQNDSYSEKQLKSHLPFIIQKFTKEQRQKQRANRPKLGLRRLTQDKRLASIDIDIPIDENTVLKEKFDWDLNKDKISPSDFARELVAALGLPSQFVQKLKEQILGQIMQHVKTNTRQKTQQELIQAAQQQHQSLIDEQGTGLYGSGINRPLQTIRFNNEYMEDDLEREENEKKKMSRMRRKELQRSTIIGGSQPNRYFKEKKICKNCKNENVTPGFECKHCKLPFELMETVNMDDRRVKISVKYYQKIANKIPLLVYEAKKRHFEKQDFDSFYMIYNKIKSIFENSDELSKENLNQVKYIMEKYHEYFLNGQLDFNDDEIIYEKDPKKDPKDDENRPKRSRGRPRKIKIINDDLEPDSLNSDDDSSKNPNDSSYYSSDSD